MFEPCPGYCFMCGEDVPCALPLGHEGECSALQDDIDAAIAAGD